MAAALHISQDHSGKQTSLINKERQMQQNVLQQWIPADSVGGQRARVIQWVF